MKRPRYTPEEKLKLNQSRIFRIVLTRRVWYLADGTIATDRQADAIALGGIAGYNQTEETVAQLIGPCGYEQARLLRIAWLLAHPTEYNRAESCDLRPTPEEILGQ